MTATVLAVCLLLGVPDRSQGQNMPSDVEPELTIGQLVIVGNTSVPIAAIQRVTGLLPGGKIAMKELRLAEKSLARLGVFVVDPEVGIRPTITIIHKVHSGTNSFRIDLLIQVTEPQ